MAEPSITCPRCGRRSYHPEDIRQGYCGSCHWWTSDPTLGSPEVIAQAERDGAIHDFHGHHVKPLTLPSMTISALEMAALRSEKVRAAVKEAKTGDRRILRRRRPKA